MKNFDKSTRLRELQKKLFELEFDAAILIHSRDVFYYTGTAQPCILVVTPNDYFLIVRRALDFVLNETWIDTVKIIESGSFKEAYIKLCELGIEKGKLGLEMDAISAELFLKIMSIFKNFVPVNMETLFRTYTKKGTSETVNGYQGTGVLFCYRYFVWGPKREPGE